MILICYLILNIVNCAYKFDFAASLIPHPSKRSTGGEDAYFAMDQYYCLNKRLLIVADGVGGWKRRGIDSSMFSRTLVENGKKYFSKNPATYKKHPKQLIKTSHEHNKNEGSSTMVVLTIDNQQHLLKTSYIGDSRYLIIRNNRIIFQAKQQLHGFNFPYQLASMDSDYGTCSSFALQYQHQIKNFDILIVGSDGLFDNIFLSDILRILKNIGEFDGKYLENKQQLAEYLSNLSIINGKNRKYISPFAVNAKKHKKQFEGGKLDDTTVIVAQIVQQQFDTSQLDTSSDTTKDTSTNSEQQQSQSD